MKKKFEEYGFFEIQDYIPEIPNEHRANLSLKRKIDNASRVVIFHMRKNYGKIASDFTKDQYLETLKYFRDIGNIPACLYAKKEMEKWFN